MKHSVELVELTSGAKGLLIDIPDASVVSFDFNFRAGDYLSPKGKWDTAHIMEHLVLGANSRYKKSRDFSREFSKNGAYNNASTGTYHMSYVAECAEFETERILDLLCLAIEAPLFLSEEFDAELANVREELKSRRNNHMHELSLIAGEAMGMCDLPYTEREKQLDTITLSDVQAHYTKTHTMQNVRFFVAGPLAKYRQAIISRIEAMGLAVGTERIPLPKEAIVPVKKPIVLQDKAVDNVYYRWESAVNHVLSESEEYKVDALFSTLLGTMHSRIFGAARERGLVYGINYGRYRTRDNHLWWIGGQVLPENSKQLFELIANELKAVASGQFSDTEMLEAQAQALGNFQRTYQTVGSVLEAYQEAFIYNGRVEDFAHIPDKIRAVTAGDVISAAQLCLDGASPWSLAFYGATDALATTDLQHIVADTYR